MVDLPIWHDEFEDLSFATDAGGGTWRTKGYEAGGSLSTGFKDFVGSNWNISPLQHPTRNPFSVAGSVLTITAKRVTPDVKATSLAVDPNVEWMSGYLVTNHLAGLHWRFGYFEYRVRIPNPARGMFPAVWMFNNIPDAERGGDGKVGAEIDLLEVFGNAAGQPWDTSWHNKPVPGSSGNFGHFTDTTSGWHRYGLLWDADKLVLYIDGVVRGSLVGTAAEWFRTADLGLRLNYAIDPIWIAPGDPLRTTPSDPAPGYEYRMEVDYVRVFATLPAELNPGSSADPLAGVIGSSTPPPAGPDAATPVTVADDFNIVAGTTTGPTPGAITVADDFNVGAVGLSLPDAPSALSVTPLNAAASLTWLHSGADVTSFRVRAVSGSLVREYVVPDTARKLSISGLVNDLPWTITVVAVGPGGETSSTGVTVTPLATLASVVGAVPEPKAPTSPTLTTVTAGPASLYAAWTAPSDNGGRPLVSYTVVATSTTIPVGEVTYPTFRISVPATALAAVLPGLTNALTYNVTVQASNDAAISTPSNALTASPTSGSPALLPSAVTAFTATARSRGAALAWTLPSGLGIGTFAGYDIVATAPLETVRYLLTSYDTSCEIAGLSNDVDYVISVTVRTTIGSSPTVTDDVSPTSDDPILATFALLPIVPDAPPVVITPTVPRAKNSQPVIEAFPRGSDFHPSNFGLSLPGVPAPSARRGAVAQLALAEVVSSDGLFKVKRSLRLTPSFEAIFYNGFDPGFPSVRESSRDNPDSSGTYDETKYAGARSVSIELTVLRNAYRDVYGFEDWDQSVDWNSDSYWVSRLSSWMSPGLRPRLYFTMQGQSGHARFMDVRPGNFSAPVSGGGENRPVQLQFVNASGLIFDFDTTTSATRDGRTRTEIRQTEAPHLGRVYPEVYPKTYPETARGSSEVIYTGGVSNGFIVRIYSDPLVATTNPRITVTAPDGSQRSIGFNGLTIPAGQFLEIDTVEKTVTLGGLPELRQNKFLTAPLAWPVLNPGIDDNGRSGVNTVDFTVAAGGVVGALAYVEVLHYNAFLA